MPSPSHAITSKAAPLLVTDGPVAELAVQLVGRLGVELTKRSQSDVLSRLGVLVRATRPLIVGVETALPALTTTSLRPLTS